jgi:hypothetical protein
MLSAELPTVKGPGAPKAKIRSGAVTPIVPVAGNGHTSATSQGAAAVPVSPPQGTLANVVSVDGPNQAGNTAVIQVYGPRPKINGVSQPQPSTNQPAALPGGIKGGGHFKVAGHHGSSGSLSWLVWLLISMAVLGLGWWNGRRKRRQPPPPFPGGRPAPQDPSHDEEYEPERQLAFAGKGDRS